MGLKLFRQAICDRCGKSCSFISESILREYKTKERDTKIKQINTNAYHYTEIIAVGYDHRFERKKHNFILCGSCINEFEEFLKNGTVSKTETIDWNKNLMNRFGKVE